MGIEISRRRIEDAAIRNNKPRTSFNSKDKKVIDNRVSVCTDCRRGIFTFQEHEWTSRGLVHGSCKDKGESETKTIT
jgi:hypothetical protein